MPRSRAFTLVELLLVIGIIALLIGLLVPTLASARKAAEQTQCAANLRQIGYAVEAYARANRGYVHRAPNWASWLDTWAPPGESSALRLINPNSANAYWGVAYFPYLASRELAESTGESAKYIIPFARRIFRCPSSVSMEMDNVGANADPENPASYGINSKVVEGKSTTAPFVFGLPPPVPVVTWYKLQRFRPAAQMIFAQDAVEMRIEDQQADTLSAYGTTTNLTAWRPGGTNVVFKQDAVFEYFRHRRKCNVLYLDWHVEAVPMSDGRTISPKFYEGRDFKPQGGG